MWDLIVVGAGAAGMLGAARAAELSVRTLLLEKNRKAGVKILISGGTRCNVTHDTDERGIREAFGRQGRFLHSALAALGPAEVVRLFEHEGVPTYVEQPVGKVFPLSDRALDVRDALLRRVRRSGVEVALGEAVEGLERADDRFVVRTNLRVLETRTLLITTGGRSYPGCGTTGDAYAWLAAWGHSIVPPRPALVPITTEAAWVRDLSGLTLPDVVLDVFDPSLDSGKKKSAAVLHERRGALLFTHFGLSGPVALDVSRAISGHARPRSLLVRCDLVPDLPLEPLDEQLRRDREREGKRQVTSLLARFAPHRLAEAILTLAELPPDQRAAELSKASLRRLAELLKRLPIPVTGTLGFEKAEVTAGGVSLDEVDSRDMQSKLVPGLYLAGEVLDLDGPIGGYNFQAAFSTGWLAGQSIAARVSAETPGAAP